MAEANKKYKDSVFTKLCEGPKRLIEIYNALANKNYPPDAKIEIATLDDALFLGRRNDAAFVIEDKIVVLMEHQSTPCENMPARLLIYITRVYEKLLSVNPKLKSAIYRTKLLKIPKPEFYVLYNGRENFPDRKELRLSDAFHKTSATEWPGGLLELTVPVYNINEGRNRDIASKSETLAGYAAFVASVRGYLDSGFDLEEAVTKAVKDCVERGVLTDFLQKHSSEVFNMFTLEFKLDEAIEVWKEEAFEDGVEKGKLETARNFLKMGLSAEQVALGTGLSVEEVTRCL